MTYLVDDKRRVTLPKAFKPGASLAFEEQADGWRVTVLRAAGAPLAKVRRIGGRSVIVGTRPFDTAAELRAERDAR